MTTAPANAPMPPHRSQLTLIVAATQNLGIGKNGTLPWPSLKSEMAYFARVTKRPPHSSPPGTKNAVIMGRKTWESIPPKFRPLRDRVNVVVTSSGRLAGVEPEKAREQAVVVATSLEEAVGCLRPADEKEDTGTGDASTSLPPIGKMFIIGGSSLYRAALDLPQAKRVLLTKIYKDYDCDTFFPLDLEGEEGKRRGWVRASKAKLQEFVGEEIQDTRMREGDVEFELCMFERG
ncbi:dihydrofolate reductase [Coniosporium apollinis CBS 100218]|uniref:Dihydrofolate reductase n=1 Tax=Coniosporium apollinis (strain CBS 100218) TaxID=1168221 RepID=R7Z284_CONA1|nr:dihydrofolate reductase [Coniosporium apollinis CBS 100218]EON68310.1 dihydrofolate reductase [Coniosporium apollinis CBS 100218]